MPVFVREGGAWVEAIPRYRNGGAWTDANDQLFVRDGGEWKLVYPDPADAGDLLPVEDLAVTSGPTWNSVTIGWTNPTQPTVTPTAVQIRNTDIAPEWVEQPYPLTAWTFNALNAETEYLVQVRLVRRVDGVITDTSSIEQVSFTTDEAPLGEPAPDPDGSGGDTIIPVGGGAGPGGTAGDTVGTAFGCWWEWVVQSLDASGYSWTDTALSGTEDGDTDDFSIDFSTLTAGTIVRVCRRTACDTTGDNSADTFGDWECGLPFPAPVDWDLACAGIIDSPGVVDTDIQDDAIWRYPKLCTVEDTPFDRLVIIEAVSGTELARGPGFGTFYTDSDDETGVAPISTQTSSPIAPVIVGGISAIATQLVDAADWSIISRFRATSTFSGSDGRTYTLGAFGGRVTIALTESATGWTPAAYVSTEGSGILTLTGDEIPFDTLTTHTIGVVWDDDGNLQLVQDAEEADTVDVSAISIRESTGIAATNATPAGLVVMQQLGWDRVVTLTELVDLTFRIINLDPEWWYKSELSATITESSGDISAIDDLSVNDRDLAVSGVDYPTYGPETLNGHSVVVHDGAGHLVQADNDGWLFTEGESHAFWVGRIDAVPLTNSVSVVWRTSISPSDLDSEGHIYINDDGSVTLSRTGSTNTNFTNKTSATTPFDDGAYHILEYVVDTSRDIEFVLVDGVAVLHNAYSASGSLVNPGPLHVGAFSSDTSEGAWSQMLCMPGVLTNAESKSVREILEQDDALSVLGTQFVDNGVSGGGADFSALAIRVHLDPSDTDLRELVNGYPYYLQVPNGDVSGGANESADLRIKTGTSSFVQAVNGPGTCVGFGGEWSKSGLVTTMFRTSPIVGMFKWDGSNAGDMMSLRLSTDTDDYMAIRVDASGNVGAFFRGGTGGVKINSYEAGASLADEEWHLVEFMPDTVDPAYSWDLKVDGVVVLSGSYSASGSTFDANLINVGGGCCYWGDVVVGGNQTAQDAIAAAIATKWGL